MPVDPQQPQGRYTKGLQDSFNKGLNNFGNVLRTVIFHGGKDFEGQLDDFQLRNALLAIIHGGFFIAIMVIAAHKKISDIPQVKLFPVVWTNVTINGNYSGLTGTKLDTCAKDPDIVTAKWGSSEVWQYQIRATTTDILPAKWMLLMGFIAITLFAHVARVVLAKTYFVTVLRYNLPRWDRWSEYAFSSSAMIIIIAGSTGVNDAYLLWTISTAQFAMVMFGLAIEALDYCRSYVKTSFSGMASQAMLSGVSVSSDVPGENHLLSVSSIKMPWKIAEKQLPASLLSKKKQTLEHCNVVGERMPLMNYPIGEYENDLAEMFKRIIKWIKISLFLTSTWIYLWIWLTIWNSFSNVRDSFDCMNAGYKTVAFDIPMAIITVEFFAFGSFAVFAAVFAFRWESESLLNTRTPYHAFYSEYIYGMLSLTSKVVLAFLLLWESRSTKIE